MTISTSRSSVICEITEVNVSRMKEAPLRVGTATVNRGISLRSKIKAVVKKADEQASTEVAQAVQDTVELAPPVDPAAAKAAVLALCDHDSLSHAALRSALKVPAFVAALTQWVNAGYWYFAE